MAIQVLELHHHGIRVGPSKDDVARARRFYGDVLGLSHDPGRPEIPTIDGYWMDVGGTAQIHLMGVEGQSKFAKLLEAFKPEENQEKKTTEQALEGIGLPGDRLNPRWREWAVNPR